MNISTLTELFKWCTIINVAVFFVSAIMIMAIPDFIYNAHGQLFNIPREAFNIVLYGFMGVYKIFILIFSLIPFIALLILGKKGHQT